MRKSLCARLSDNYVSNLVQQRIATTYEFCRFPHLVVRLGKSGSMNTLAHQYSKIFHPRAFLHIFDDVELDTYEKAFRSPPIPRVLCWAKENLSVALQFEFSSNFTTVSMGCRGLSCGPATTKPRSTIHYYLGLYSCGIN